MRATSPQPYQTTNKLLFNINQLSKSMKKIFKIKRLFLLIPKKLWLQMRLIAIFSLITVSLHATNVFSQTAIVEIELENATLADVFREIEKQSDYCFFYNSNLINTKKIESIKTGKKQIAEVLEQLFENTDLSYKLVEKYIVITAKDEKINQVSQQAGRITGRVVDNDGPIAGATVIVKGTSIGTTSNSEGQFTLNGVTEGAVIQISFIGYITQEIVYRGQSTLSIKLVEDVASLEEVVVTAMGITREQKALGYAVTTIKSVELTKVGSPNFATALYGKAPGVRIQSAQGGSVAGVSITVRGLSSINGSSQPLIIKDGVPIRNGGTGSGSEAVYAEFGSEGRIRSNGLVDINPEDIEDLTILKGAAATALYGSEAANGVVMITSKKAKSQGVSIDFNAIASVNTLSYVPKVQTEYGPSRFTFQYNPYEVETGGFYQRSLNGVDYRSLSYGQYQWGPRFDGSDVLYWDGKVRKYEPISSEPWKQLFRNGFDQMYNLAIMHGGEKTSTRFSYTFKGETPNGLTGTYSKHDFNLVGSIKVTDKVNLDYSANYVIQDIFNRAQGSLGIYGSFTNGFGAFLDVPLLKKMYKTSLGYRNVVRGGDPTLTPDESFAFSENNTSGVRNMLWDVFERNVNEIDNRLIASVAPSWKIVDWLTLRGRLSTDLTAERQESRENTERPLSLYDPSGKYQATTRNYNIYYGDIMLMSNNQLTEKLNMTVNIGWQGRLENMLNTSSWTDGGLANENWFHLNASRYTARTEARTQEFLKTAVLGSIGLTWENYLFLEATGRQEKTSTLREGSNTYFYPSVSASFIFTDAFRFYLPEWYDFGKLRASYGVVGNAPGIYSANVAYEQGSNNGFVWNHVPGSLGNEKIKPEKIYEYEFGLESRFFKNRLGFEVSYYNKDVVDMILNTPQPTSAGVDNMLLNVGEMNNRGVELSLYGTPVETGNFSWTISGNISRNYNKITKLVEGVPFIQNAGWGGDGCIVRSVVGRPMGDFYAHVPLLDDKGNKLISDDGYYINNPDRQIVGNAMPKFIGGISNSFSYKNFHLDVLMDYRIGGDVYNEMYQYSTALGITPETLKGRTAETGGLAFYYANNVNSSTPIAAAAGAQSGPNGEVIYHNGVIQEGIVQSTGLPNQQILPIDYLTYYTYNWGTDAEQLTTVHSIFTNSYLKMRELTFGYRLPKQFTSKFGCKSLYVSAFGRNLFYIYKGMKNWDAESSVGTAWIDQAHVGGTAAPTRSFGFSIRASF